MAGLYDLIPGLKEVEDAYRADGYEAFAGVEAPIAGTVEILPFTPQMFLELDGADNGCVVAKGKAIMPADVLIFLWRTSPKYCRDPEKRRLYFLSVTDVVYDAAVSDIQKYIIRAWQGMPLWITNGKASPSVAQWPSRLVHMFAKNYGWSEEYILNLPFRRLWQYANRICESADPKFKEICGAGQKVRSEWLKARNASKARTTAGGAN